VLVCPSTRTFVLGTGRDRRRWSRVLRSAGVDLLSPYPRIIGAGRLVQPLLQWSWLTFLPLRAMERSPRPSLAAAGGQWLVADRAGYERAGGHAAVAGDVLEDIGLARAVKRSGGRVALADASAFADCLMYPTWRDLRDGYSKSLHASFGSPAGAAGRRGPAPHPVRGTAACRPAGGGSRCHLARGGKPVRVRDGCSGPGGRGEGDRRPGLAGRAGASGVGGAVRLAGGRSSGCGGGPARTWRGGGRYEPDRR
jgi:hypothetical protein